MDWLELVDTGARFGAAACLPIVCVLLFRLERRVHGLSRAVTRLELDLALLRQRGELERELLTRNPLDRGSAHG